MTDPTTQGGQGYSGQMGMTDGNSDYNALCFVIQQMLANVRTVVPCRVLAVTAGGLDDTSTVDVQPLVNQMDGLGNATPHGTVLSLPVMRWQGGSNAVILDPAVGDIGLALVCDRDISAVVANKDQAVPGSFRRFSLSDGIYLGGILNGVPTQYVQFTDTGIILADKNSNKIETKPGSIAMTTTSLTVTGSIISGFGGGDQVGVQTHLHTANNTPPTPGS